MKNDYIGGRGSINGRGPSEASQTADGRKLDLHEIVVSTAGMPLEISRTPVRIPGSDQVSMTLARHLRAASAGKDVEVGPGVRLHDMVQVELQVSPL